MAHAARVRSLALATTIVAVTSGCSRDSAPRASARDDVRQQAVLPAGVRETPTLPERIGSVGHAPSAEELRIWDRDVSPDGHGLPAGRGTFAQGAAT